MASPLADSRREAEYLGTLAGHVAGALLVAVGAPLLWLGNLPSRLLPGDQPQVVALGAAYLAIAVYALLLAHRRRRGAVLRLVIVAILIFAASYVLLGMLGGVARSRGVLGIGLLFSIAAAVQQLTANRVRGIGIALALLTLTAFATGFARRVAARSKAASASTALATALTSIEVRTHSGLTGPKLGDGGGIAAMGRGFLVVTGRGAIFQLAMDSAGGTITSRQLPIPSPMDRIGFLADQPDTLNVFRLRVTGITLDTVAARRLFVAHQHWSREGRCFTLRVSSIDLASVSSGASAKSPWTTEFESSPCMRAIAGFDDANSGGRLAWTAERELLLTLGDFGFDGIQIPDYPQDTSTSYGKVLRRDHSGNWSTLSLGHRNPQGLLVDQQGRIWETEHGPKGGDELNLLVAGQNFGWPRVTYGTQYGADYWPLAPNASDHASFTEPAHVFVPSIGVSNLIEVRGASIPQWTGDLLVGSLASRSLYRVRQRGGRVSYVEPIPIGKRVRDLTQGADGVIALWTDDGDVLTVSRHRGAVTPAMAYGQCKGCHEVSIGGTALGPSLRGVMGRKIGRGAGYPYSASLPAVGGVWTVERLDAFLRDPKSFAPGTAMTFGGVGDLEQRRKIIEYLRTY